jgi:hypothetical protein
VLPDWATSTSVVDINTADCPAATVELLVANEIRDGAVSGEGVVAKAAFGASNTDPAVTTAASDNTNPEADSDETRRFLTPRRGA